MKVGEATAIVGIIGATVAGFVLGLVAFTPFGIWAGVVGAILGGIAGFFVGINAVCIMALLVLVLWQVISHHRKQ